MTKCLGTIPLRDQSKYFQVESDVCPDGYRIAAVGIAKVSKSSWELMFYIFQPIGKERLAKSLNSSDLTCTGNRTFPENSTVAAVSLKQMLLQRMGVCSNEPKRTGTVEASKSSSSTGHWTFAKVSNRLLLDREKQDPATVCWSVCCSYWTRQLWPVTWFLTAQLYHCLA